MTISRNELARMIDHTLLKPESAAEDIQALINEAAELNCYSVCVSPSQLPVEVPEKLQVATVCGFPSGAHQSEVKAYEAATSVQQGADEVDMVIDIAAAHRGDFQRVADDIRAVRMATDGALLKVIIESAVLTDNQIIGTCQAAMEAGADFVKTSTGFHPAGGASTHAVKLVRETVGDKLGVKASGGIRDAETALSMIEAGASRLGCSSTRAILEGLR